MANSFQTFIFSLLFSNVILSFIVVSHATSTNNNDFVSMICPKTKNPPFCTNLLKSTSNTDLNGLAIFTLNLARTNAEKDLTLAKSLAETTKDPQLKKRYSSCSENYDEAIGDIENAQKKLASGDFNGVNIVTSGVMTTISDCEENFNEPPVDNSLLLKDGKTLNDICSIILVISNLLPRPM